MKTIGIVLGILVTTAVLGWIVVQTLKTDRSDAAYNMHPSNFEKPDLEHTVELDAEDKSNREIADLNELLKDMEDDSTS